MSVTTERKLEVQLDKKVKSHAISSLRRGSYRWPGRWEAEKRSHIGRGEYCCENPDCGLILKKKETSMDHVEPVVDPLVGYTGLDSYAERLYVEAHMWQRLCDSCHSTKSKAENLIRKETAKKKETP
jgi:hypothetical protein